jgi:hypothetical protein
MVSCRFFIYFVLGLLLLWALNLSRTRKSLNKAGEIYTATARESAGWLAAWLPAAAAATLWHTYFTIAITRQSAVALQR